jgi:hypothetical protein
MKHSISRIISSSIFAVILFALFFSNTTLANEKSKSKSTNKTTIICDGNQCEYPTVSGSTIHNPITTKTIPVIQSDGSIINEVVETDSGKIKDFLKAANSAMSGTTVIKSEDNQVTGIYTSPGIIENVTALYGHLYVPTVEPASDQVVAFFQQVSQKLNPIDSVQAQASTVYFPGLGYNILQPIHSFWSMNRNIAYGFQIIIVFIIALMLLFRSKLNGQQVISLMNALPSIVLSIILISISYPLSGLFIDVITLGSNLAQSVLISSPGSPGYTTFWQDDSEIRWNESNALTWIQKTGEDATETLTGTGSLKKYDQSYKAKSSIQIDDPLMSIWLIFGTSNMQLNPEDMTEFNLLPDVETIQTRSFVGGLVNSFSGIMQSPIGSTIVGGLGSELLKLVFVFAAFMASLKIFFALLKEWITLVVFPVISPFLFLFAALPSVTGKMLSTYFTTMLSSALSFVAVYAVFLFILVIGHTPTMDGFSFLPPLLGYSSSATVDTTGQLIRVLIGYGLYLSVPLIPDAVKQFVSSGSADIFGKAGGEIMKGTAGSASQFLGLANNIVNSIKKKSFPE